MRCVILIMIVLLLAPGAVAAPTVEFEDALEAVKEAKVQQIQERMEDMEPFIGTFEAHEF